MIRTYTTTGGDGRIDGDIAYHSTATEAEAAYWRNCAQRTDGVGVAHLHPPREMGNLVAPGRYRLDREWRGPREQEHARWLRLWALPLERGGEPWGGVQPHEIQGIIDAAGWSQVSAAQALGVDPRSMRRWVAGDRAMGFAEWVLLRDLAIVAIETRAQVLEN